MLNSNNIDFGTSLANLTNENDRTCKSKLEVLGFLSLQYNLIVVGNCLLLHLLMCDKCMKQHQLFSHI